MLETLASIFCPLLTVHSGVQRHIQRTQASAPLPAIQFRSKCGTSHYPLHLVQRDGYRTGPPSRDRLVDNLVISECGSNTSICIAVTAITWVKKEGHMTNHLGSTMMLRRKLERVPILCDTCGL